MEAESRDISLGGCDGTDDNCPDRRNPAISLQEAAAIRALKQLALELRYPAYTGLPPQKIENGGDVVAVSGTTVMLNTQ